MPRPISAEGLLSQTLTFHINRRGKIPFSPLASVIGLQPLPGIYFAWLVGSLFCYAALMQSVKV